MSAEETSEDDSRVPALRRDAFDCPRCGAYANQNWVILTRQANSAQFDDSSKSYGRWSASLCARCRDWTVWREARMMYPTSGLAPVPHTEMPPEAKALYEEAREVVGISRRAGTALARASLERLLRTLDPDAGRANLAARIERIIAQVPEPLGKMLTVIRFAGNASLHVDDEPDDVLVLVLDPGETEVVELIFEAINELVEERIAKPAKVDALYSKIPESVRERVDKAIEAKKSASASDN